MTDQENALKPDLDKEKTGLGRKRCSWKRGRLDECDERGWWEDRTLAQKILIGTGFGLLGIGFLFLCGWAVMLLWNWLMPDIFGLKPVTYWQAWGLLILCSILFKGFGSGGGGRSDRKRRRHLRRYLAEEQAAADDSSKGE